jgi:hypothetical protein
MRRNAQHKSKGDRLNWTPLSKVKKVSLSKLKIKGKIVHVQASERNILVP